MPAHEGETIMSEYGSTGDAENRDGEAGTGGYVPPSTPHHSVESASPFDVTPGSHDVIGTPEPAKARRAPVLLAMIAVLVVVLAAGAVAFVKKNDNSASALTKLVPAGSYGYLQIDLKQSSSAGLYEYLSHFPGSPATKPEAHKATFRDTLLNTVFVQSDKIDYTHDIQPWLGNSAGVAVFRGNDGNVVPMVVVATTDAAKAKTGLAHIRTIDSSFAYDIVDGNVLLAQHQADLDEARAQAKTAALPSSGKYSADIATLPSGSLVTMWADLDKITAAVKSAMTKACVSGSSLSGGCSTFNSLSSLGLLGGLGGSALSGGRIALGVTVADKVATLTVRELGHKTSSSSATVGDGIKALPADTTGAIALGDVSTGLTTAMTSLSSTFGALMGVGLGSGMSESYGSATAPTSPPPSLDSAAFASSVAALAPVSSSAAFPSAFPSAFPTAMPSAMPDHMVTQDSPTDPTKAITDGLKQATGLAFPGDFTALLGDRSVIAVGDVPLSAKSLKDLQVGIRSHPKDVAKAQALAQTLTQHLDGSGIPFTLGSKAAGGDFVLASSQAYADKLAETGKLGSNAQFTAAMGDLSGAHFAAYVDLSKFTGILSATRDKAFSGFKALGIVERTDGADAVIQIKLIAG